MRRRSFLGYVAGSSGLYMIGCLDVGDGSDEGLLHAPGRSLARDGGGADGGVLDGGGADGGVFDGGPADGGATTIMYDTYAIALYFDGSQGPKTGVIKVDYILENQPVELDFWHGHGGRLHGFTLLPEHFEKLKLGERVYIQTTEVANHSHKLFIDPVDPKYRVPGALPIEVPL